MKKISLIICATLLSVTLVNAQVSGNGCYIKGTSVEIGLCNAGGFEGADTLTAPTLAGMHGRTNTQYFGFVANPQLNSWASYDGDYFTPGSPENGWGYEIGITGGISGSNNCDSNYMYSTGTLPVIHGNTVYTTNFNCLMATFDGDATNGTNLHWKIVYMLHQNDLYYTTTVSVTNNTTATIPDLYYYRNLDPDNDETLSFDYTTTNTVDAQPNATCQLAHVSATQTLPWNSYLGLAAVGANWRAVYGGFANRDASDLWYGVGASFPPFVQTVGVPDYNDEAIALAYRIQNLAPGATETFKFVVILDAASAGNAINNLAYLTYPNSATAPPPDCTPWSDTIRTCGSPVPVSISGPTITSYTFSWSPVTGLSTTTGPSVIANPATTTTYTLTGTPLSACVPPLSMTFVVEVTPASGANPIINPVAPMCLNDPAITLTADSLGGTWSGPGITNSSLGTFNPSVAGVGSWTISYTTSTACNSTDTVIITVFASGNPTITQPALICSGSGPITLSAVTAGGVWSGSACINPATGVFDPTCSGVGVFTITYTIAGSCSTFDTVLVTVASSFNPTINQPLPMCVSSSGFNLTASSPGGVWSGPGIINAATGFFDPNTAGIGNWTITYTISGACAGADTVVVQVLATYIPTISSPASMCSDVSTFNLFAMSGGGTWSGVGIINPAIGTFSPSLAGPGVWPITYTIGGLCGFTSVTTMTVIASPTISFTADTTQGCAPTTIHFTSNVTPTGGSYFWDFGFNNSMGSDTSHLINPSFTYTAPGTYSVYFSYNNINGCGSDTLALNLITIHNQPQANFSWTPLPVSILLPTANFHDLSLGLVNTWDWNFYGYGTSSLQNPTVTYSDTGYYATQLIVSNIYGCTDSIIKTVYVEPYFTCHMPNAFTPNGDGSNDEFRVYGTFIDPDQFEMSIFDRWGERIYHNRDLQSGWNGGLNNSVTQQCELGVYVYRIWLRDWHGEEHIYMGNVTLIR